MSADVTRCQLWTICRCHCHFTLQTSPKSLYPIKHSLSKPAISNGLNRSQLLMKSPELSPRQKNRQVWLE